MEIFPLELAQIDEKTLGIKWSDGKTSHYNVRELRLHCRCALCVDEWTGEKKIHPVQIPFEIRPKKIESVGRYALGIEWSDGHSSGIYTFDSLRSLGSEQA